MDRGGQVDGPPAEVPCAGAREEPAARQELAPALDGVFTDGLGNLDFSPRLERGGRAGLQARRKRGAKPGN